MNQCLRALQDHPKQGLCAAIKMHATVTMGPEGGKNKEYMKVSKFHKLTNHPKLLTELVFVLRCSCFIMCSKNTFFVGGSTSR